MPIGDYATPDPVTVREKQTVREAASLMKEHNIGSLLVVADKRPVGVLTDRDIALGVIARRRDPEKLRVSQLMSKPVVSIPENASVGRAARAMRRNALRRLPVVDRKGRLKGIVTSDDLLQLVSSELAQLGQSMRAQAPGHSSLPAEQPA